ncbi:rho-related protein racD-like, partial [Saccostrea cucullata]|uniref:rho-related protein racD-like n=1 Tax=Saccostrea cuccullata TaxID=36930 RepID=UPI002ED57DF2
MRSRIKCSIVGETMVGKTTLLKSYVTCKAPAIYSPTIYENIKGFVVLGHKHHKVNLVDTAGQHEYSKLCTASYCKSKVIILCYSVIDRPSFDRIKSFWIPEIRKNVGKSIPIVLTATHTDLRSDKSIQRCIQVVSSTEGRTLADSIGAKGFFEISKSDISQTNDIFECAVRAVISKKKTLFTILKKIFCSTCKN